MSDRDTFAQPLADAAARERFRTEWRQNFAVSANAGSGKTTAISERLAVMAMSEDAAKFLPKTAVVTFTKKAAQQIGQRARAVLLRKLTEGASGGAQTHHAALDHLERAFFGTIHSFCLVLAQRYGQSLGVNLNPEVVGGEEDACWEEFLEQDAMTFRALSASQLQAFLRHVPLQDIFELARGINQSMARHFLSRAPVAPPPPPDAGALDAIGKLKSRGGAAAEKLLRNQENAVEWARCFREEKTFLPFIDPDGSAAGIKDWYALFFAPVKNWLADASAALAAELAERYRIWRFERGVQTYADQIETALSVLHNPEVLEKIRADGWRVILDEAQDTDPMQFAVLVEITRPSHAQLGAWPRAGEDAQEIGVLGAGPRPGHFCMVGDGQQAIYGSRADIRNFLRHVRAYGRGDGGELLSFEVTFRTPQRVIAFLNDVLPSAFGEGHDFNFGLPPAEGAEAPKLQVDYQPLKPGPANGEGLACHLPLRLPEGDSQPQGVDAWMNEEVRQLAEYFLAHGPAGLGAKKWGDVCLLAPVNKWLLTAARVFEKAGLKIALQVRKNRNGDNPVYAWVSGLLAAVCDPENAFEWFGVLREVFAVSDAVLAAELQDSELPGGVRAWRWDEPEEHEDVSLRAALNVLRPFVLAVDNEGVPLSRFACDVVNACGLRDKARLLDTSGGLEGELERLLADAATFGLEGAGPREWLQKLRDDLDAGRPTGKAEDDSINLLTSHSAKGLEWPVIVPLGFWRGLYVVEEPGLRIVSSDAVRGAEGGARVFFDSESMPRDLRESRKREAQREQVRLLYVTLTRAKERLVIPWCPGFGTTRGGLSFAELLGHAVAIEALPVCEIISTSAEAQESFEGAAVVERASFSDVLLSLPAQAFLPQRLLPHQLAHAPVDAIRAASHEASSEEIPPSREGDDAIDYGLWWHSTMESLPWSADDASMDAYFQNAVLGAEALSAAGAGQRGREELARLRASEVLRDVSDARWSREAELSVFAPASGGAWIDGIMDLVIHDAVSGEVRVIDWKTNRRHRGESDEVLLARLAAEYEPQLRAYGRCVGLFFSGARVRLFVYSTAAGKSVEIATEREAPASR